MGGTLIYQFLLTAIALLQLQRDVVSSATPQWTCYPETGSCYYLSDFDASQPEASDWCKSNQARLLKVDSSVELSVIETLFSYVSRDSVFWIGATDRKRENHFVWEDNTAFELIPWHYFEPNDVSGAEDCVVISRRYHLLFTLYRTELHANDANCYGRWNFFCEKALRSEEPPANELPTPKSEEPTANELATRQLEQTTANELPTRKPEKTTAKELPVPEKDRRQSQRVFKSRSKGHIPGLPLEKRMGVMLTSCVRACHRRNDCQCLDYNDVTKECRLFGQVDYSKVIPDDDFVTWAYYIRKDEL